MADGSIYHVATRKSQVISNVPGYNRAVRTVLVCGNSLVRAGLTHLLADTSFALVASELDESCSCERYTGPELFIVDASGASQHTIETVGQLKAQHPEAKVVTIAERFDLSFVHSGRGAGVDGFCSMVSSRDVLMKSLELVMLGETLLPSSVLRAVLDRQVALAPHEVQGTDATAETEFSDPRAQRLSVREAQILKHLMGGEPNKVIARKLDVAEATVKVHIKAILRKIRVVNRTQAAMWAAEHLPGSSAALHA